MIRSSTGGGGGLGFGGGAGILFFPFQIDMGLGLGKQSFPHVYTLNYFIQAPFDQYERNKKIITSINNNS